MRLLLNQTLARKKTIIVSLTGAGVAAAAAALALTAAAALGVFPDSNVTHYTGCLNTNGSAAGGAFNQVAVGDNPAKTCGANQTEVHLSGGDISAVRTASGSGLTGGTENGVASLSLDPTGCATNGVLKWSGTAWVCGADNTGTDAPDAWFAAQTETRREITSADGRVTVTRLTLLPGNYALAAKGFIHNATTQITASSCSLHSGTDDIDVADFSTEDNTDNFSLLGALSLPNGGVVDVECQTAVGAPDGVFVNDVKLLATNVATIH